MYTTPRIHFFRLLSSVLGLESRHNPANPLQPPIHVIHCHPSVLSLACLWPCLWPCLWHFVVAVILAMVAMVPALVIWGHLDQLRAKVQVPFQPLEWPAFEPAFEPQPSWQLCSRSAPVLRVITLDWESYIRRLTRR